MNTFDIIKISHPTQGDLPLHNATLVIEQNRSLPKRELFVIAPLTAITWMQFEGAEDLTITTREGETLLFSHAEILHSQMDSVSQTQEITIITTEQIKASS